MRNAFWAGAMVLSTAMSAKAGATYYTPERVRNAQRSIEAYKWAQRAFATIKGGQHGQSWHGLLTPPVPPQLDWRRQTGTLAGPGVERFGEWTDRWGRKRDDSPCFLTDIEAVELAAPAAWEWQSGLPEGDALGAVTGGGLLLASSLSLAATLTCRKELEITGLATGTAGFFANADTKIASYNGAIYCAYLDRDLHMRVRKKRADGVESDGRVFGPVAGDQWHAAPVIGLDGAGYIHVTGAMHDSREWCYFISAAPESPGRFVKQERGSPQCPPGQFVSYPEFARDNKGYLYVSSRQGTKNPGHLGGSIARYDHTNGTWTSLGTDVGQWTYVLWFEKPPAEVRCYQKWCTRMHFDRANTLHLAWKVNAVGPGRNYNTGTHVMYAALPEGKSTWRKADGRVIPALPLTIDNASVIATDFETPELFVYGVGASADGTPIVNFRYSLGHPPGGGDKGWIVTWTGSEWQRCRFPREIVIPTFIMSDNRDRLFTHSPGGNVGYLSRDNGGSWEMVTIPYDRGRAVGQSFDYQHFVRSGNPRIAAFFDKEGVIEVWTIVVGPEPE